MGNVTGRSGESVTSFALPRDCRTGTAAPGAISVCVRRLRPAISETPSNFRTQYTVPEFLARRGIPGIVGVDTRQIVLDILENGRWPVPPKVTPTSGPAHLKLD